MKELLAINDLIEAAHRGSPLKQDWLYSVREAEACHLCTHRLLRWEAVHNLHMKLVLSAGSKLRHRVLENIYRYSGNMPNE